MPANSLKPSNTRRLCIARPVALAATLVSALCLTGQIRVGNAASATPVASPAAATNTAPVVTVGSAARLVPVISGGYPMHSPEAARLYGPGAWIMDGLWNIDVKRDASTDRLAGIRFRAPFDGNLASIKLYWSDGAGYAGGDGGDIQIELRADDGSPRHLPDWKLAPIGTGRRVPTVMSMNGGVYGTPSNRFVPDKLTTTAPLKAGQLYHLIAFNTASDPITNWSSWDMQWTMGINGAPSRWTDPLDFSALAGERPAGSATKTAPTWYDWSVQGHNGAIVVPILQATMEDGRSFGNSNMETGNTLIGDRAWQLNSGTPVRERFRPTRARTVTGLSLHTALISGSGGLDWQILRGSTEIAAGTITQATPNARFDSVHGKGKSFGLTWYDIGLPASVNLAANETYDVVFTPQESSVWAFVDQRNGLAYGFTYPSAFTESQAQVLNFGVWMDANHWSHKGIDSRVLRRVFDGSNLGSNWRVVFHTR